MADFENQRFFDLTLTPDDLRGHSWEGCEFHRCSLQGLKHGRGRFVECAFHDCDLSNLDVGGLQFTDTAFHGCKMLGIRWHEAPPLLFSVRFDSCNLSLCDFYGMKLRKLEMRDCRLHGAIFEEADLRDAHFGGSDFTDARFHRTNLAGADFADARHYAIDPLANTVRGARFRFPEAASLLTALGVKVV